MAMTDCMSGLLQVTSGDVKIFPSDTLWQMDGFKCRNWEHHHIHPSVTVFNWGKFKLRSKTGIKLRHADTVI